VECSLAPEREGIRNVKYFLPNRIKIMAHARLQIFRGWYVTQL